MKLAVIGVGLIGGSFAAALKQAGKASRVTGAGRSRENLELARRRGLIDAIAPDAGAAARDADFVMVAAPVAQFADIFAALAPTLAPGAVVTDGGSTKCDVIAEARRALGSKLAQFVPAHPIAGAEHSGAQAASATLFRDRRVVLTPLAENAPAAVERVADAWRACGARVSRLGAEEHDAVLAAVSHLPHVLAFALVDRIARHGDAKRLFSYAAGGFRDFTRIASSNPEMWRDVCIANRKALLAEVERYGRNLDRVKRMLARADAKALEALFSGARDARERWLKNRE